MSQKPNEPRGRVPSWIELLERLELVGPIFRVLFRAWRGARFFYVSDLAAPFRRRVGAVFIAIWILILARAGIFGYANFIHFMGEFSKISGITQITFYIFAVFVVAVVSLLLGALMKRANAAQCFFSGLLLSFIVVVVLLPRLNETNFGNG